MNSRLRNYSLTAAAIRSLVLGADCALLRKRIFWTIRWPCGRAAIKAAGVKPTPRVADGHPDLNGSWGPRELPVSAHQDSQSSFYIDAPPWKFDYSAGIPS